MSKIIAKPIPEDWVILDEIGNAETAFANSALGFGVSSPKSNNKFNAVIEYTLPMSITSIQSLVYGMIHSMCYDNKCSLLANILQTMMGHIKQKLDETKTVWSKMSTATKLVETYTQTPIALNDDIMDTTKLSEIYDIVDEYITVQGGTLTEDTVCRIFCVRKVVVENKRITNITNGNLMFEEEAWECSVVMDENKMYYALLNVLELLPTPLRGGYYNMYVKYKSKYVQAKKSSKTNI